MVFKPSCYVRYVAVEKQRRRFICLFLSFDLGPWPKKNCIVLVAYPTWLLEVSTIDRYMQSVLRVELGPCCPCQNSDIRLCRDSSKDRSKFHLFEGSSGLQFTNFSLPFSLLLMKEIRDRLYFRCKKAIASSATPSHAENVFHTSPKVQFFFGDSC